MVEELSPNNFSDFIKEGTVLIDFYADWCMPCVMMSPIVDEMAKKFEGKAKVGKVNVDDNQELAQKYGVSSIPNFIIFKNGEIAESFNGSMSEEEMEEKIQQHL
ncbi:MAG: thioredoxin [Candidatus Pacearchaeota archaeon]